MHGKGKYTYSTGKVYDGMWAEDRPVMFFFFLGKYTYITGKVYDGMWVEERPVMFFFKSRYFIKKKM
jgi:hypothetical protein